MGSTSSRQTWQSISSENFSTVHNLNGWLGREFLPLLEHLCRLASAPSTVLLCTPAPPLLGTHSLSPFFVNINSIGTVYIYFVNPSNVKENISIDRKWQRYHQKTSSMHNWTWHFRKRRFTFLHCWLVTGRHSCLATLSLISLHTCTTNINWFFESVFNS